jgi:site-specific DNA-methyltransferase (cytosine-N4-specific)
MGEIKFVDNSWDFKDDDTKISNHGFHTYPAMMISQVARRLIETYGKNAKVLLDPFMGSGTALLEAKLHENFEIAYGIDINPLSLLIAKVKTTPIDEKILLEEKNKLIDSCLELKFDSNFDKIYVERPEFLNINFWFKKDVITDLAIIKKNIDSIKVADEKLEKDIKDFFWVAFSETARRVSNTRNSEFKLYRMAEPALKLHNPTQSQNLRKRSKLI